jgi:CheY-like chemotaxis protein
MTSRVVLVDDVAAFRRLVATALRLRGGFEVVGEAADGQTAVEVVVTAAPDVVVLDLGLPDLAGTEVIGLIRDQSPRTKIVVFTGRDVDGEAVRSVEGFVRKDADVQLLVDVLVELTMATIGAEAVIVLPNDITSAARARAFVEEHCSSWGLDAVVDDALLIVSELVTNAVVHAESEAELRLVAGTGILRVEVADQGGHAPDPQLAGDDDEHGRGLLLVTVLSAAWGTEARPDGGKVVWADLALAAS